MKGFGEQNKFKKKHNKITSPSKEKIINQAFLFHSQGNIIEAERYYKYCIDQEINDYRVYSNYGLILKNKGNFKEAEISLKKAIQLNPNWSEGHNNIGTIQKDLRKFSEAKISLKKAIELDHNSVNAHCNLGNILRELKNFQEAEIYLRKVIELDPNSPLGYANLGDMLKTIGRVKEAKILLIKTIEINPNFVKPYFSLSKLQYEISDKKWHKYLFSEQILNKKNDREKINIYFSRSNILHKEKKYYESSKNLQLANKLKLALYSSECKFLINRSQNLLKESEKNQKIDNSQLSYPMSIFILGMPRSGSTLVESILSMNKKLKDLGEVNILEKAYIKSRKFNQKKSLADLYMQELNQLLKEFSITTNKWLYNYQYAGIIANQIPNCKIIHCLRNPLDNILSLNRANFESGNYYSSSLRDSAKVYLDQEQIMDIYKDKFRQKIYDLNYDLLVKNPHKEIKSLINWLGWKWNSLYLSPELNKRAVYTASNIQVRSPINSKSIGGWKKYKEMLRPAMEIITQKDKYKDLKY
ncbi:MAG: tetratricopeptide repeat protein [Prochlorococcus marinus CUG1431]|uniref:Tetratricopeptide repeat protein n=1 Tax=Prochlorococcus marinus CUG1433 TaxID=2774506 RepID=A0A9D9FY87_PROMR|nr:tetratricopeptide repeat protein [Prochlorococcus marinus CUG1433]MBO6980043.1 tetratricopeptide repeat protein [Prochlorococcus marinus CUG1431]